MYGCTGRLGREPWRPIRASRAVWPASPGCRPYRLLGAPGTVLKERERAEAAHHLLAALEMERRPCGPTLKKSTVKKAMGWGDRVLMDACLNADARIPGRELTGLWLGLTGELRLPTQSIEELLDEQIALRNKRSLFTTMLDSRLPVARRWNSSFFVILPSIRHEQADSLYDLGSVGSS